MSDFYIRLIPTDPNWQPTREAAAAAAAYAASLFSGPGNSVEEVTPKFYGLMTLIDAGGNTGEITCPRCGREIGVDWLGDLVWRNDGLDFDHLRLTVPCCGAVVPLYGLHYEWLIGVARFEVEAMNPCRAQYELDAAELARVGEFLGHPVTQILAHY